jgi:hypothetical protein
VVALLLPFPLSGFRLFQFTQVCVYAMVLLGLNLLTGYNGQISLGHGAFYALGAYTTAIMIDRWGVAYGWTIPAAGLVCFVVSFLSGSRRSARGLHLALATFPPSLAVQILKYFGLLGQVGPRHRALEAEGAVGAAAVEGPVALLPRPVGPPAPLRADVEPPPESARARHRRDQGQPDRRPGDGYLPAQIN